MVAQAAASLQWPQTFCPCDQQVHYILKPFRQSVEYG
jgi:hypothetical protein